MLYVIVCGAAFVLSSYDAGSRLKEETTPPFVSHANRLPPSTPFLVILVYKQRPPGNKMLRTQCVRSNTIIASIQWTWAD